MCLFITLRLCSLCFHIASSVVISLQVYTQKRGVISDCSDLLYESRLDANSTEKKLTQDKITPPIRKNKRGRL